MNSFNSIHVFNKAITHTLEDGSELFIFGLPQEGGGVRKILTVIGVCSLELGDDITATDLIKGGCDLTNAMPILQFLQQWRSSTFPETETIGLENKPHRG